MTGRGLAVAVLGLSVAMASAEDPGANRLVGTWELIEASPVSLMDSLPGGVANRKEYYAPDGKLYFLRPDEKLGSNPPVATYSFDGTRRRIVAPDGKVAETPVVFLPGDRMKLVHRPSDEWTYARLTGPAAYDLELEPRSVERLATNSGDVVPLPAYDTRDYSSLPPADRIRGVWELAAVKGVPGRDIPPYGFTNDVWVMTAGRLCVVRPSTTLADGVCALAMLSDGSLHVAGPVEHSGTYAVAFDRWQRLVLSGPSGTRSFKLLGRDTSAVPLLPVRIVLLEP